MILLMLAMACKPAPQVQTETDSEPPLFETPWEGLTPNQATTGAFTLEMDDEVAGPAWFHTDSESGSEGGFARLVQLQDAAEPVVSVSITGRDSQAWISLQLNVAQSAWVAGSQVNVNGNSAIGVLRRHDDSGVRTVAYVVDGQLSIDEAGLSDGQAVVGSFYDLQLAEVSQ